jgi:serine/threonine protein phosphatase PrpC
VQVFVSHVGDCRAVLSCNDGVTIQLTEDHKASNKAEKLRIEAAKGWVHNGRVNGDLGVSRSIGDIRFKLFDDLTRLKVGQVCEESGPGGIWAENQQVISKPDCKYFIVEKNYEFVILASDGLWDVFNCSEVGWSLHCIA